MSKVLGYTNKAGQHWFKSDQYDDKEIEGIKDPEGGATLVLPTAIPSPFARIDLVRTAFKNVNKSPDLTAYNKNGNTVTGQNDEKLVSDTLDLAEMLFNIDTLGDKMKIIVWDKDAELAKLKQGNLEEHRRLAETLEMYFNQDADTYNFDLVKRFYIFKYNNKVIGCTSPSTLFFTTGNDLKHAQIKLTTNDVIFDEDYAPLYARDPEFQKYLYLLFKANPLLQSKLKIFNEYLQKNLMLLDSKNHSLYNEINNLDKTEFDSKYDELNAGISGDIVEVLGIGLRKRKKEDIIGAVKDSDFTIASSKYQEVPKPLVLQNNFAKPFQYANDQWKSTFKVPYVDNETILEKRKLPELGIQYPYLTVSDFLEPYLIRLVYPINDEKFFDGNLTIEAGNDNKSYLLPLKPKFFEFFDTKDLLDSLPGKPTIKIIQTNSTGVKVELKIPVAKNGEFISFSRIYYETSQSEISKPDEENNKGVIVEQQFGVTVFPFIRTENDNLGSFYRVQLIDRDIAGLQKNAQYDLKFFQNSELNPIDIRAQKVRSDKKSSESDATSQYYVLDKNFDFIQIRNTTVSDVSGIIVPKWKEQPNGNDAFSFAVDFGTTNTHIEYKIGNQNPKTFNITEEDTQIATLFHPSKTSEDFGGTGAIAIREMIDHEFLPRTIGKKSEYKFPHRTTIAESKSLNIGTETFTLADFNIPFIYERKPEKDKIHTNLKWAKKEPGNEKRIRAYFEEIILMMRNKVLLNNGNLSQTRLIWFYPSSMKPGRRGQLKSTWDELFNKYFNPDHSSIGIAESLAPFYYFKGSGKLKGGSYKPVVSIDIGGGTSDVVIFQENAPKLMSSFKFAANSIFGDGFSEYGTANSNGMINKYLPYFEDLLNTNKLYDLTKVLSSIKDKNRAEDINAFFFSIENNPKIKDKLLFSYNNVLSRDEDLKILFLYFYASLIYHIANLMESKNIDLPKHIIFSGTGSKLLNIITSDFSILSNFSKLIFEKVYDEKFDRDGLTVEIEKEMPKEVTCKGGLMTNPEDLAIDVESIEATLTCIKDLDSLSYNQLDDAKKDEVVAYVERFNNFFLNLNSEFSFSDYFSISNQALDVLKSEVNKHLRDFLEEGLTYNRELDSIENDDKEIEETLFFHPITGTIHNLINQLAELSPINN